MTGYLMLIRMPLYVEARKLCVIGFMTGDKVLTFSNFASSLLQVRLQRHARRKGEPESLMNK